MNVFIEENEKATINCSAWPRVKIGCNIEVGGNVGWSFPLCEHCRRTNHRSDRCWQKFGKPDWVANSASIDASSSSSLSMMTISHEYYDRLMMLQEIPIAPLLTCHIIHPPPAQVLPYLPLHPRGDVGCITRVVGTGWFSGGGKILEDGGMGKDVDGDSSFTIILS